MKVLVTVATKHGSTAEIADVIARTLIDRGIGVVLQEPEDVESVDGYDAVVLGSAVYAGHWLKPAIRLTDRLGDDLALRPVWVFSSGPIGDPPMPEGDPVDVAQVVEKTKARGHRIFAGRLDKNELGLAERAVVRALRAPEGDFRDWEQIRDWAGQIADELRSGGAAVA